MRLQFFGKVDPNKVLLSEVITGTDTTFSTPLFEKSRFHRVIIEGSRIARLEVHLNNLIAGKPHEPLFGQWIMFEEHEETGGWELVYNPMRKKVNTIQLLVLQLRKHLVQVCDLCLQPVSILEASRRGRVWIKQPVLLPPDVGNGHIFLPEDLPPANVFHPVIIK